MMVVQVELRRVVKKDFPHLAVECVRINVHFESELLERSGGLFPEFEKAMFARKSIGLQQNFVLAVMYYVTVEMPRLGMLADVLVHGPNCTIFRCLRRVRQSERRCAERDRRVRCNYAWPLPEFD